MSLNCKISNKLDDLQNLHEIYKWVPGRVNIRPTPETIQKKGEYLNRVRHFYATEEDCILEMIFKFPTKFNEQGKLVMKNEVLPKLTVFSENLFPYKLPDGTKHWVLWYSYIPESITEEEINKEIYKHMKKANAGKENFEFVWYENPKRTLKSGFHVQVFWHNTEK